MPPAWESPADFVDLRREGFGERFGMPAALVWLTDYTDYTDLAQMVIFSREYPTFRRIGSGCLRHHFFGRKERNEPQRAPRLFNFRKT